ncbi:MAG: flagellar biosynthesis anti-sigma factor FlgM [Planctomycetota bacterium]|jgi:anti-sigma28 factor (negative regulator of flagellin synthesis)
MPEIRSIGQGAAGPVPRADAAPVAPERGGRRHGEDGPTRTDRVELSSQARLIQKLQRLPAARSELIEQVRDAIASGTYETEGKLRVAMERLLEDLDRR